MNEAEADTVRHVFRSYLALGSVRLLQEQLAVDGVREQGGAATLPGRAVHAAAQPPLPRRGRAQGRGLPRRARGHRRPGALGRGAGPLGGAAGGAALGRTAPAARACWSGCCTTARGERMTPSHANKGGRRYRYYVSKALVTGSRDAAPSGRRVPAGDLERLVVGARAAVPRQRGGGVRGAPSRRARSCRAAPAAGPRRAARARLAGASSVRAADRAARASRPRRAASRPGRPPPAAVPFASAAPGRRGPDRVPARARCGGRRLAADPVRAGGAAAGRAGDGVGGGRRAGRAARPGPGAAPAGAQGAGALGHAAAGRASPGSASSPRARA